VLTLGDFRKVELGDKAVFDDYYTRFPPRHSSDLFTSIISWEEYVEYRYVVQENCLLLMSHTKKELQLRVPIGPFRTELLEEVIATARKEHASIGYIKATEKEHLLSLYPSLTFIEDRDLYDYVYQASDLATLPGTAYAKIRNRLHKFTKETPYTIENITDDNMDEVHEFLKRWCLWKDCASDEVLENERKAIVFSMAHFFDLGLSGIALRIDGTIEAISVFEQMNVDTAVIHFEKGSPDYDGIYKAVNMEAAKRLQSKVAFIDREEDLGIPGLRKAKLSYHPHHFVEVYHFAP
jgi:hypothetical protein